MKKLLFWASTFLLLLFAVSCEEKNPNGPSGGGDANKPDEISPETSLVEGLVFTEPTYTVYTDIEFDLRKEVLVFPEEVKDKATVKFYTSNSEIVQVSIDGKVIGKKVGEAVVLAKANGYEVNCKINVKEFTFANFTETVKGVSFDMIAVEGGNFQMGATAEQGDDAWDDEYPVHDVTLSSFYLSKTEVTQAQYQTIMGKNPSYRKRDNLPVEQVSWYEAKAFCEKLSQLTGKNYVLPTEAQWEYAARGGKYNEGTKYAGSNNADEVAWYWATTTSETHPVATKAPNALGLYDMSGNVWEWCADWWGEYSEAAQTNPTGPERGVDRVIRAARSYYGARRARVSYRSYCNPYDYSHYGGFRVAMIP